MAANKAALETKGQKPADTKKMQANVETINELETLRSHLFDDGQALCQRNDKAWLRAYIHKQLLKQMRRASPAASAGVSLPRRAHRGNGSAERCEHPGGGKPRPYIQRH